MIDYVSDARKAYEELGPAWEGRTVTLLASPHARTYAAMFAAIFPDMTESVPDTFLYEVMDEVMAGLAVEGVEADWPMAAGERVSGREAARRLMDEWGWLERDRSADHPGHYDFRLTIDGMRAMSAIRSLARRDSAANGAVMDMLLDRLNDLYTSVSGDPVKQRAVLEEDVRQARARLAAFDEAGGASPVTHEDALDKLRTILSIMDPIVEGEAMIARRLSGEVDALLDDLREEDSVAGEVIEGYYQRSRDLQYETRDGHDYRGVVEAMSASDGVIEMDDLVDGIVASPAFEGDPEVRRRIDGRWRQVADGARTIGRVLDSASARITAATATTSALTRRSLLRELRRAEAALAQQDDAIHAAVTVPHVSKPPRKSAPCRDLPRLAKAPSAPPAPIVEAEVEVADPSRSLARKGGPHRARVARAVLDRAVVRDDGLVDVTETFGRLDDSDRRLIEAMSMGTSRDDAPRRVWEVVDADGRHALWEGPEVLMTRDELEEVASGR